MTTKAKGRGGMSGKPPALPGSSGEGAEAFVRGAAVHVAPHDPSPPEAGRAAGRPRKYDAPMKPLTIRVPEDCYEDLRFLAYALRAGSIQAVAADLLEKAAKAARAEAPALDGAKTR